MVWTVDLIYPENSSYWWINFCSCSPPPKKKTRPVSCLWRWWVPQEHKRRHVDRLPLLNWHQATPKVEAGLSMTWLCSVKSEKKSVVFTSANPNEQKCNEKLLFFSLGGGMSDCDLLFSWISSSVVFVIWLEKLQSRHLRITSKAENCVCRCRICLSTFWSTFDKSGPWIVCQSQVCLLRFCTSIPQTRRISSLRRDVCGRKRCNQCVSCFWRSSIFRTVSLCDEVKKSLSMLDEKLQQTKQNAKHLGRCLRQRKHFWSWVCLVVSWQDFSFAWTILFVLSLFHAKQLPVCSRFMCQLMHYQWHLQQNSKGLGLVSPFKLCRRRQATPPPPLGIAARLRSCLVLSWV